MSSARLTPRYIEVIDSGAVAPASVRPGQGPQLVSASRAAPELPQTPTAPRSSKAVLALLPRRAPAAATLPAPEVVTAPASAPVDAARPRRAIPVARRPWRVLIVSAAPGTAPRSFEVSRFQARAALAVLGLMVTLAAGFVAAVATATLRPGLLGQGEVQALEAELDATRDSLALALAPESGAIEADADSLGTPSAAASSPTPALGAAAPSILRAPVPAPRVAPATVRPGGGSPPPSSSLRSRPAPESDVESVEGGVLSMAPRTLSDLPVIGAMVSGFSRARRHPLLHRVRPHLGVDLAAPRGTRVSAPAPGVVTFVGRRMGFGLVVEMDHGAGVLTRYAHLRSAAVHPGETVRRGEAIAAVGTSGVTTGPHLHYEVMVHGHQVDPLRVRFGRADASTAAGPVLAGHAVNPGAAAPVVPAAGLASHDDAASSPAPPPR